MVNKSYMMRQNGMRMLILLLLHVFLFERTTCSVVRSIHHQRTKNKRPQLGLRNCYCVDCDPSFTKGVICNNKCLFMSMDQKFWIKSITQLSQVMIQGKYWQVQVMSSQHVEILQKLSNNWQMYTYDGQSLEVSLYVPYIDVLDLFKPNLQINLGNKTDALVFDPMSREVYSDKKWT